MSILNICSNRFHTSLIKPPLFSPGGGEMGVCLSHLKGESVILPIYLLPGYASLYGSRHVNLLPQTPLFKERLRSKFSRKSFLHFAEKPLSPSFLKNKEIFKHRNLLIFIFWQTEITGPSAAIHLQGSFVQSDTIMG